MLIRQYPWQRYNIPGTGLYFYKFIFFREASKWWCNSNIKKSKVKVTGNENVKIIFCAHLYQT